MFELDKDLKEFGKLAVLIFLVWILFFFIVPTRWTDGNLLGDNFGIFNTLFSGLAFAALVYTLNVQIRDYRAQHSSNAEVKAVQERTAKALESAARKQSETIQHLNRQAYITKLSAQLSAYNILHDIYHKECVRMGTSGTSEPWYKRLVELEGKRGLCVQKLEEIEKALMDE